LSVATAAAAAASAIASAVASAFLVAFHLPLPAAVRTAHGLAKAALRVELLLAFCESEILLAVTTVERSIRHESTSFRIAGVDVKVLRGE
jgi:hypothetical protein